MESPWKLNLPQEEDESPNGEASARAQPGKRRLLLAGLALCVAVVGVLTVWSAWQPRHPDSVRQNDVLRESEKPKKSAKLSIGPERDPARQAFAPQLTVESLKKEELELTGKLMADLPDSSDAVALTALVHERYGNSADAVNFWQKALDLNPNRADAYDATGWVALQKEEYEKAAGLFRKALEIHPTMPGVHNNLAGALVNLGRPEEAVKVLVEAIEIFPRAAQSHFMLGQVSIELGEYEKAKQSFEIALKIQPGHRNAYYGLATAYSRLGQRDKFKECMEKFKSISVDDLDARIERTRAFDDLASVRRGAAQTYTNVGRVYFAHGDPAKAKELWLRAATLDPANTACRRELARLNQSSN